MAFALTPLVIEHGQAIEVLTERLTDTAGDIERIDRRLIEWMEAVHILDKRLVVLETQLVELKRASEEADRRRWTLVLAALGVILTLVANIVLTLIRK